MPIVTLKVPVFIVEKLILSENIGRNAHIIATLPNSTIYIVKNDSVAIVCENHRTRKRPLFKFYGENMLCLTTFEWY